MIHHLYTYFIFLKNIYVVLLFCQLPQLISIYDIFHGKISIVFNCLLGNDT